MSKLYMPLSSDSVKFTPPSLDKGKKAPVFTLRQPTENETDYLGQELFRRGIQPVTVETVRATMIDDLFNHFSEEEAEEKAQLLESVWQFDGQYQADVDIWVEVERERKRDIKAGGPEVPQLPFPKNPCHTRTRAKAHLLSQEMTAKSQRLRDLTITQNSYNAVQSRMMSRLYIMGWTNLKTKPEFDADDITLTEDCLNALFKEIGPAARRELERHINESFNLDEEEVKNSDLPAESAPDPTGSPTQSGELASSDGNSTGSDTPPTPAAESDQTTEES